MFRETYVVASITDAHGNPACQTGPDGNFLHISNGSRRYPAYYGLSSVLNQRLLPTEKSVNNVSPYYQKNKPPVSFGQRVTLKYWVEE
jgi:hypothetical protein